MQANEDDKAFAGVLEFLKETGQQIRHFASGEIILGPSRRLARLRKREADRARMLAAEQKRARKAAKLAKGLQNV